MTNLNPADYQNGVPVAQVAVAAGETVKSSSSAITLGPAKAIAALVATPVVAFLSALGVALQSENVVTGQEWVSIAIATILSTGLVAGSVYGVPTSVTGNRA